MPDLPRSYMVSRAGTSGMGRIGRVQVYVVQTGVVSAEGGEGQMSEETMTNTGEKSIFEMAVPCIICGQFVVLNERETQLVEHGHSIVKACRECKDAVAFMKAIMASGKITKNSE